MDVSVGMPSSFVGIIPTIPRHGRGSVIGTAPTREERLGVYSHGFHYREWKIANAIVPRDLHRPRLMLPSFAGLVIAVRHQLMGFQLEMLEGTAFVDDGDVIIGNGG